MLPAAAMGRPPPKQPRWNRANPQPPELCNPRNLAALPLLGYRTERSDSRTRSSSSRRYVHIIEIQTPAQGNVTAQRLRHCHWRNIEFRLFPAPRARRQPGWFRHNAGLLVCCLAACPCHVEQSRTVHCHATRRRRVLFSRSQHGTFDGDDRRLRHLDSTHSQGCLRPGRHGRLCHTVPPGLADDTLCGDFRPHLRHHQSLWRQENRWLANHPGPLAARHPRMVFNPRHQSHRHILF